MSDRCTGHCCRRIFLPFNTRAEILASGDKDAKQISEMVIPLEDQYVAPDGMPVFLDKGLFFTCNNLLPNGDCGIYQTTPGPPAMCSNYPDGYRCHVPGCQWTEARSMPIHPNHPSRAQRKLFAEGAKQARRKPHPGLALWVAAEKAAGRPA